MALTPAMNLLALEKAAYKDSLFLEKNDFYTHKKEIRELIEEYSKLPGKYFVNKSYFLYDRSNLTKNTYITVLNKTIESLYMDRLVILKEKMLTKAYIF